MHLKDNNAYALEEMIKHSKQHMCQQFGVMTAAKMEIVLGCNKYTKCNYMREVEQEEEVTTTD